MRRMMLLTLALLLTGCALGPKIDRGIGTASPRHFGWNIGAADLLDPSTAATRLAVYLDELTAAGYAKQIRIIYTPAVGPFILQHWVPVIRAKGYRLNVILAQSRADVDLAQQSAWARTGLPAIRDILEVVQLANEVDRPQHNDHTPARYAVWHRALVAVVRETVPGVQIVGPDLRNETSSFDWIVRTGLVYGVDYDIVSLHVTGAGYMSRMETYKRGAERVAGRANPRVWITEGDWGQTDALSRIGLLPGRTYVYVWNGNEPESRRPGGPLP